MFKKLHGEISSAVKLKHCFKFWECFREKVKVIYKESLQSLFSKPIHLFTVIKGNVINGVT